MHKHFVTIIKCKTSNYPKKAPFHASLIYPEFRGLFPENIVDKTNHIYDSVRESFHLLRYDYENYNAQKWNPLGWLIRPGESVFIKPNMISQKHRFNNDWDYVITNGSIIRAVIDYVFLALKGKGRIIIGDGPQADSDFSKIVSLMGLNVIRDFYKQYLDFKIEVINLQDEHWIEKDGIYVEKIKLTGDPEGSIAIDLSKDSMFAELDRLGKRYYGAFYNIEETNKHHRNGKHEYKIAKTPISVDVFINVPKLKTHKKCGITLNLKGLVGINANKNWLPHYVFGSPETGGDQFPKKTRRGDIENRIVLWAKRQLLGKSYIMRFLVRIFKNVGYRIFGDTEEVIRSGNWHGNDTVWRMVVDLNRILMYANSDENILNSGKTKRFFSVVDGIVSMEGNGPVAGTRKETGIIVAGENFVAVDAVGAQLMGFNCKKLPIIHKSFEKHPYPLIYGDYEDIHSISNEEKWNKPLSEWSYNDSFKFKPHFGWERIIAEKQ